MSAHTTRRVRASDQRALPGPPAFAARPALPALLAILVPVAAEACAVCGGGNPANRFAFFASTVALSLLPLGLFVGAFLWLRSRLTDRGRLEFGERDATARPPADRAPRTS